MLNNLYKISDVVFSILEENPKARNSDNYLYYKVLENIGKINGVDIEKMSLPTYFLNMKSYGLPSLESVGRARRKIVAEHPELIGCDDVEAAREMNEEVYKAFARKVEA